MSARDAQDLPRRIDDLDGRDAYALLGVPTDAGPQEIAAAYKREMARAHPDRGGSAQRAQLVNCAYEVLTQYRDSYDEFLDVRVPAAGSGVLYIEPDAEPLDEPAARSSPWRRGGLLGLMAVGAIAVAAVMLTRSDPPGTAGWTATGTGVTAPAPSSPTEPSVGTAPAATPLTWSAGTQPSSLPATVVIAAASAPPAGGGHRCEVRADGSLWCAGRNSHGQLGNGTTRDSAALVRAGSPGQRWRTVAVGGNASCGLQTDQSLWCWGDNSVGQLGDGTNSERNAPVLVEPAGDWLDLDVDSHVCAVRVDHSLWCWGAGRRGQLGDGGGVDRATPIRLGADTGWSSVTVGPGWTCGVRLDGGRRCWGAAPAR